jgi:DNA polymerase III alpha subunit (gram-positive type)
MRWWQTQPEAWQEVTTNAQPAADVMQEFNKWVLGLGGKIILVAHPIAFDYAFVSWYIWKFVGSNPFVDDEGTTHTLDLGSYIAGKFDLTPDETLREHLPAWMKENMPEHSHNALDDARGYGVILRNILSKK